MFELPEAAHRFHLLQVPVEGQAAQTEAVAAVADGLQPLHLFHYGGHGDGWRHRRRRGSAGLLSRNRLFAQSLLVWPEFKTNQESKASITNSQTPIYKRSIWSNENQWMSKKCDLTGTEQTFGHRGSKFSELLLQNLSARRTSLVLRSSENCRSSMECPGAADWTDNEQFASAAEKLLSILNIWKHLLQQTDLKNIKWPTFNRLLGVNQ